MLYKRISKHSKF